MTRLAVQKLATLPLFGSAETAREAAAAAIACGLAIAIAAGPARLDWLAGPGLAVVACWIAWRDARDFIIPDGASASLAALALGVQFAAGGAAGTGWSLVAGLACGAALLAVREGFYRLRGHDGLGFGDVKLAAASGILVGVGGFSLALFAACLAGVAVALLRGREARGDRMPLGALLAPAVFAVWAFGLDAAVGSF